MNLERVRRCIRKNQVSISAITVLLLVSSYSLFIIPGTYYIPGIQLLSLSFLGQLIISESNDSGGKRSRKQRRLSFLVLTFFFLFIITSTGAASRFGIDQALRPPEYFNDSENQMVIQDHFLPANNTTITNSTNESNGTHYTVYVYETIGMSSSTSSSATYSLIFSEIISVGNSGMADANDALYLTMNDASGVFQKNFHSSSKWLKKNLYRKSRKKSKRLKRLESTHDKDTILVEYQKILDEALFSAKVIVNWWFPYSTTRTLYLNERRHSWWNLL